MTKALLICPADSDSADVGTWREVPWDGVSDMTAHVLAVHPAAHSMDCCRMAIVDGRYGVRMIATVRQGDVESGVTHQNRGSGVNGWYCSGC
jgi:hypothetical protein